MIYNYIKKLLQKFSLDTMEIKIHLNYLLFELLNNERVKNKKDAREGFKIVKKNVKNEALKQIVKELEHAIFEYDDDKDKEELEETEELDKRFKTLIRKKYFKSLKEAEKLDKRFKNLISKQRLKSFKEY